MSFFDRGVKRSISSLLQAVINLIRQHLPWKFTAEKLLGQILRLRLRLRAECQDGRHDAKNKNSSNGIGTRKF
ncbi:MAG: hypothetical protein ACJ0DI_15010 [bacterium]